MPWQVHLLAGRSGSDWRNRSLPLHGYLPHGQLAVLRAEKAGETTVDISKGSLGHYQLSPTIPKTCPCFYARLFST